jgi:hypothetical protein
LAHLFTSQLFKKQNFITLKKRLLTSLIFLRILVKNTTPHATLYFSGTSFIHNSTKAQQRRLVQFGTVTSQEMKMTAYEKDSTATAVVLYDKGYFDPGGLLFRRDARL